MTVDLINKSGYSLRGLGPINVLVGKNGCGKSSLLRQLDQAVRSDKSVASVRYLTPERSGILRYQPGIDNNITANANWLTDTRRANQFNQFREQSVAQFRNLELVTLRRIQNERQIRDSNYSFDQVIAEINGLLDNIEIRPAGSAFEIRANGGSTIDAANISSGEAELISLAIEVLVFEKEASDDGTNLLLMDEPDLHLHPDLQHRLARFVAARAANECSTILIATHSTSLIAALADHSQVRVAFMRSGDKDLRFTPLNNVHRRVLPVFGAHPLSQVFNESPILLVEGEDDERVWQQAVRSAEGRLKLFPRSVGGLGGLDEFEREVAAILRSVYDNPRGYSVRDGDATPGQQLEDLPPLVRLRLNCRAAENLLVSNEVLQSLEADWTRLEAEIKNWLRVTPRHPAHPYMKAFSDSGFNRRQADLKEVRNLLVALTGSNRPWEIAVGVVIAGLKRSQRSGDPHSIYTYLGPSVVDRLIPE